MGDRTSPTNREASWHQANTDLSSLPPPPHPSDPLADGDRSLKLGIAAIAAEALVWLLPTLWFFVLLPGNASPPGAWFLIQVVVSSSFIAGLVMASSVLSRPGSTRRHRVGRALARIAIAMVFITALGGLVIFGVLMSLGGQM